MRMNSAVVEERPHHAKSPRVDASSFIGHGDASKRTASRGVKSNMVKSQITSTSR
jgi:hypothetical protein